MAQLVFDSENNLVLLSLDHENGFNTLLRLIYLLRSGCARPGVAPMVPVCLRRPFSSLLPRGARCLHGHWVQAGGYLWFPLVRLLFSLFRMLSPSESKTMPVVAPPPPGVSAFIDDTGSSSMGA